MNVRTAVYRRETVQVDIASVDGSEQKSPGQKADVTGADVGEMGGASWMRDDVTQSTNGNEDRVVDNEEDNHLTTVHTELCVQHCSKTLRETRMVQLPATAAIEYVAACRRTRTRTRTKTKTETKTKSVRGAYARSPQVQCVYAPSRLSVPSIVA